MKKLDFRQLAHLSHSGVVRLGIKVQQIERISQRQKSNKPTKKSRKDFRNSKKWEEFRKRFAWVDKYFGGIDDGSPQKAD